MPETFCGKSCAYCNVKEEVNCPGCLAGPGNLISGDCPISYCCRQKGRSDCFSCEVKTNCVNWNCRETMPEYRKQWNAARAAEKIYIAQHAPVMAKCFTTLFIAILISNISFPFTSIGLFQTNPLLFILCSVCSCLSYFIYAFVLFRLSVIYKRYSYAGLCADIIAIHHLLEIVLFQNDSTAWFGLLSLITYAAMMVEGYHFFKATSEALNGVDDDLSAKWSRLWKWYKCSMIGPLASFILILIPILGFLVLAASMIGIFAVYIIKLIYVFKTVKAFKRFTEI